MDERIVVVEGDAVKAIGDNKVGGYLVRFSTPKDADLSGEFFTDKTEFGPASVLPVLYHHGFDGSIGKRILGKADVKFDDTGMWLEAQLEMRDEYEKMVFELAKQGKLGWSSGSLPHLVEYEQVGKSTWIKTWIVGEASLTPTPAEYRNFVIPLKSYISDNTAILKPEGEPEGAQAPESEGGTDADINPNLPPQGEGAKKMELTPELLQQTVADAVKEAADAAVKAYRESEPPVNSVEANLTVIKDEADQPWANDGEFFKAVKVAAQHPHLLDRRLLGLKTASGNTEAIPSEGGFLVPPGIDAGIRDTMWSVGSLLSLIPTDAIGGNRMIYNWAVETSRCSGSRYGGITSYWLEEGGTKTVTKPTFRQVDISLNKITALCVATDELLADSGALASWLGRTVPNELRFQVENAIINGTGVGQPLGILATGAILTSCARTDATEIDAYDVGRMWAARLPGYNDYVWLVNQNTFPQLINLTVGDMPVFLPAGGLGGMPYGSLLGRPVLELEYMPALGTAGDITLFAPSAYQAITKAGGIESASSIHVYFATDETAFRFVYRFGGAPVFNSTITGFDSGTYSPYVVLTATT